MTTSQRLKSLKSWVYKECCMGKRMKAPGEDNRLTDILRAEPKAYVGWAPARADLTGEMDPDAPSVCPSILIGLAPSKSRDMEEKRFDRYNSIHRPKEMGATLNVSMLLCVYEPGDRLPGFRENPTPELLVEATEQGFFALMDWIDELCGKLLAAKNIPGTDLFLWENTLAYSPYLEMNMLVDKRPFYYGFVNCSFGHYSDEAPNGTVKQLLD